ncbi:hypothetical protein CHARACLAT_018075 [Characodon lateralis]|uniref:Uncharacterized protein n=1 Tax=Characodon lateralis TaxID=208331 RepID=A0ABU7EBA2_9TELE|nr:hypothetical protein [Characodon lateralis]
MSFFTYCTLNISPTWLFITALFVVWYFVSEYVVLFICFSHNALFDISLSPNGLNIPEYFSICLSSPSPSSSSSSSIVPNRLFLSSPLLSSPLLSSPLLSSPLLSSPLLSSPLLSIIGTSYSSPTSSSCDVPHFQTTSLS